MKLRIALTCIAMLFMATAKLIASPTEPVCFFTNVASRLLQNELNVDLHRIEVYPTNQYTPAVHRLLQVSANIYDATSTNYFPTVFRPMLSMDGAGNIFITDYTNVIAVSGTNDIQLAGPVDLSTVAAMPAFTNLGINVYGIPWIIAAKKGFPNFNKLSEIDSVIVSRPMVIARAGISGSAATNFIRTNYMYNFSIGSAIGVQFWNSYSNAYTNEIIVAWTNEMATFITNSTGMILQSNNWQMFDCAGLMVWPGSAPWDTADPITGAPQPSSFLFQTTNVIFLNGQNYNWLSGNFDPSGVVIWQTNVSYFPILPHLFLSTSQRFRSYILDARDAANGIYHVIDYVQLAGPNSTQNLWNEIQTYGMTASYTNMWSWMQNAKDQYYGLQNQIDASRSSTYDRNGHRFFGPNQIPIDSSYWKSGVIQPFEIDGFYTFMGGDTRYGLPLSLINATQTNLYNAYLTNTVRRVPFTPYITIYNYTSYQANDPLVHYTANDLTYQNRDTSPPSGLSTTFKPPVSGIFWGLLPNMDKLNDKYGPWGRGYPLGNGDQNRYNLAYKDPLATSSDNWDFPVGQSIDMNWLGRVHRGTPWQTLFLKATNILELANNYFNPPTQIGMMTWTNLTGDADTADATAMAPIDDRRLISILALLLKTNDLSSLLSINNPDPTAWQGKLDGLTAIITNVSLVISSNSPEASIIANAIETARQNQPSQIFSNEGDLLAVQELSDSSPFLNNLNPFTQKSDEAYEAIPSQLLSLIRSDSIGSMVSSNGQWLIHFTGYDTHPYAIQVSTNLIDWSAIETNCPVNGVLTVTNSMPGATEFYRSVSVN